MLFDRRCPVCGNPSRLMCLSCVRQLDRAPEIGVAGLDQVVALFAYDELSSRVILAGKNGGRRDLLRWSARNLTGVVAGNTEPDGIDLVTWVPAHPAQRRGRGFDQGELLARTVAKTLRLPSRNTLRRRGGTSQKGLGRSARLDGPRITARRQVAGSVLLVDDVVTTVASLERCASSLREAGAANVVGAVVAASGADRTRLELDSKRLQRHGGSAVSALGSQAIYNGSPSGVRPEAT